MKGLPSRQTASPTLRPDDINPAASFSLNTEEIRAASNRAFGVVVQNYAVLMNAIRRDKSLTDWQRTSALYALKMQRRTEATEARKKAHAEELQRQKEHRQQLKQQAAPPSLKRH